jgi:peptide/nickel transport system substrate-binding protein
MRNSKKWAFLAGLVLVSLIVGACQQAPVEVPVTVVVRETQPPEVQTQVVVQTQQVEVVETQIVEVEITPTPEPVTRTGAWIDTVVIVEEPSADAAVTRLDVGDIDIYAFAVANAQVVQRMQGLDTVESDRNFGSYDDLTFNTAATLPSGGFNPFSNAKIREAMNWLVDRNHIAGEIYGGLARPRWVTFNGASNDYAALADIVRSIESKYAYNMELAEEVITTEMEGMGATLEGGVWTFDGAPVNLIFLIRTEDNRLGIGDYVSNQLEAIGFTVTRDYKTAAEAGPIWLGAGEFHIYTGGWVTTAVPRDLGANFSAFYTPEGRPDPLWQNYTPSPEFSEVANALANNEFTTLDERREMMATALDLSLLDSSRVWLVDRAGESPRRAEIQVAADLYSAVYGSQLWPYTIRREGEIGGSIRMAMPSILTQPWSPSTDSSNWVYDSTVFRATGQTGTNADPYTGLLLPNRIESASVVVQEGLPVGTTLDWVTLEFASEIPVPADAWADWDAETQTFIPAGDGVTALSKSTVTYPADLFETVSWHDGSPISVGDFVMFMIQTFDRGKEASPYYDPAKTAALNLFLSAFKGVKIVSTDPLVIETYTDAYALDAENNVTTWWPYYTRSEGAWHTIALGLGVEQDGLAAFSTAKAATLEVDQLNYIAGPTVALLDAELATQQAAVELPYAPTLGEFVSADEAAARFTNLAEWKRTRGHYWVGTGAFYLERAFPVEGTIILQRNPNYPDLADKWSGFSAPAIPEVELDGPTQVTIGDEAVIDVNVTFQGAPYAAADITEIKYLVFDAEGALAASGVAEGDMDGHWVVTLDADTTGALAAGSNRLEVIAVSKRVALPAFVELLFVTAP